VVVVVLDKPPGIEEMQEREGNTAPIGMLHHVSRDVSVLFPFIYGDWGINRDPNRI
jgi:hypothetical protein